MQNRGRTSFDFAWTVFMEDSRILFDNLITEPADPDTPDHSPSPRATRTYKSNKASMSSLDASLSPTRKNNGSAKDGATGGGGGGGGGGNAAASAAAAAAANATKRTLGAKKQSISVNSLEEFSASSLSAVKAKPSATALAAAIGKAQGVQGGQTQAAGAKREKDSLLTNKLGGTLEEMIETSITEDSGLAEAALVGGGRGDSRSNLRAESSMSQRAPSTMFENGYIPFSVEPALGKIEAGKTKTFKVYFAHSLHIFIILNKPSIELKGINRNVCMDCFRCCVRCR